MTDDSIATEVLDGCPCCARSDTRHWCYATDLLLATSPQTYEYHRCGGCFAAFLRVRPRESEIDRIYPADYHPYLTDGESERPTSDVSRPTRSPFRLPDPLVSRIKKIANWKIPRDYKKLGVGDVFLDFGCGSGKFLDRMRGRGCTTIGMDFSPHALATVARNGHQALRVSTEGWEKLPLGSVDYVRMNHVLEHLYRARENLEALRDRMKPGAILHVAVPNPDGLSALLFGRNWHGLDCPRHVVLYPPTTLAKLLADCGFTVTSIVHEALVKDHVRSWIYRLQAGGRLVGRNPDDFMDRLALQALAAIPMLLATVWGRGDRIHVFARREG